MPGLELELQLLWSPEAEADLLEIWRWGAMQFSPDTADAHLPDIKRVAHNLTVSPFADRARDDLHAGVRSVVVYPTVVFYRVGNRSIDIVRVVDGRRNLAAIFTSGGEPI